VAKLSHTGAEQKYFGKKKSHNFTGFKVKIVGNEAVGEQVSR
jgi:hypothetical protein